MDLSEEEINKIKHYMLINKAPKGSFVLHSDIKKFLKNKRYRPQIYIHNNDKPFEISKFKIYNPNRKKDEDRYYYQNNTITSYFKIKQVRMMNRYGITSDMVKTSEDILDGNFYDNWFSDKLDFFNGLFSREDSLLNIQFLLKFTNYYKEIIWFLTYEEEFIRLEDISENFFKNKNFLKDFSRNTYNSYRKILKGHNVYFKLLLDGKSLQESMLWWLELLKKYPNAIGYIESKHYRYIHSENYHQELKRDIINDYNKNNEQLVESVNLDSLKGVGFELTTRMSLKLEGNSMRHCVSGYSSKVKSKYCRIFHIEFHGEKATLEIIRRNHNEVKINQLKGFANNTDLSSDIKYIAWNICREFESKYIDYLCEIPVEKSGAIFEFGLGFGGVEILRLNQARARGHRRNNRGLHVIMDFENGRVERVPNIRYDFIMLNAENGRDVLNSIHRERKKNYFLSHKSRGVSYSL